MKAFLVFLAFMCPFLVAEELAACGICTMVVDLLETQGNKLGAGEELLKELTTIADEVCAKVPQEIASQLQCKSYIDLNAPYIVDLLLSDSKPESICKTIGICSEPDDSTNYKFIFPIITEQQITYLVEEKEITKDSTFNYKLFLAYPSFLNNQSYQLDVELNQIVGCEVNLKVTNKTTFVQSESCSSEKNCSMAISQPGRGVWYYVTVHAKMSADEASFSLNATEKNETLGSWILVSHHTFSGQRFAFILCLTFASVCLLCMCISRCMFSRRRYKLQKQAYAPIMMQPMPETMFPMQDIPMFASQQHFDPDNSPMIIMYAPQPVEYGQV